MRYVSPRRVCTLVSLCAWLSQAAPGISASAPATLSGTLSDAATGKPLAGMFVMLINDWGLDPKQMREDTTDAGGRYFFPDLSPPEAPNRAQLVVCTEPDRSGCKVGVLTDISPGQDRRQDFRLSKPIVWDFRVVEKSHPDRAVTGAHVAVLTPVMESFGGVMGRTHIGRSDAAGRVRMQWAAGSREAVTTQDSKWLVTDLNADVMNSNVQVTISKAGYRTQVLTKPIVPEALILDAGEFPHDWVFADTFSLEAEASPASRTLSGTVTDHVATSDGMAVLFTGTAEGKPFMLFDYVQGDRLSLRGIPGSVMEGTLFSAFGDSLRIAPEDFSHDFHLTTRSPVPTGLTRGRADRKRRPVRFDPGAGKNRVDALGRRGVPLPKDFRAGWTGILP